MDILDDAFSSRTGTDKSGRFRRPWSVAVAGCAISFAVGIMMMGRANRSGASDAGPMALMVTGLIGSLLSIIFAVVGARVGKAAASKVIGVGGLLLILLGVAYVIYMVKSFDPTDMMVSPKQPRPRSTQHSSLLMRSADSDNSNPRPSAVK